MLLELGQLLVCSEDMTVKEFHFFELLLLLSFCYLSAFTFRLRAAFTLFTLLLLALFLLYFWLFFTLKI